MTNKNRPRLRRHASPIRFDTPQRAFEDIRKAAEECPWCGDEVQDDGSCARACASSRRTYRTDRS